MLDRCLAEATSVLDDQRKSTVTSRLLFLGQTRTSRLTDEIWYSASNLKLKLFAKGFAFYVDSAKQVVTRSSISIELPPPINSNCLFVSINLIGISSNTSNRQAIFLYWQVAPKVFANPSIPRVRVQRASLGWRQQIKASALRATGSYPRPFGCGPFVVIRQSLAYLRCMTGRLNGPQAAIQSH